MTAHIYDLTPNDSEKKRLFAEALHRYNGNAVAAANAVEADPMRARTIAQVWPFDPEVIAELQGHKATAFDDMRPTLTPTKDALALEVLQMAREKGSAHKDRLAGYALAAKLLGYVDEGKSAGNVNNITDNRKVYIMPARAQDINSFEARSTAQQARLINHANN